MRHVVGERAVVVRAEGLGVLAAAHHGDADVPGVHVGVAHALEVLVQEAELGVVAQLAHACARRPLLGLGTLTLPAAAARLRRTAPARHERARARGESGAAPAHLARAQPGTRAGGAPLTLRTTCTQNRQLSWSGGICLRCAASRASSAVFSAANTSAGRWLRTTRTSVCAPAPALVSALRNRPGAALAALSARRRAPRRAPEPGPRGLPAGAWACGPRAWLVRQVLL